MSLTCNPSLFPSQQKNYKLKGSTFGPEFKVRLHWINQYLFKCTCILCGPTYFLFPHLLHFPCNQCWIVTILLLCEWSVLSFIQLYTLLVQGKSRTVFSQLLKPFIIFFGLVGGKEVILLWIRTWINKDKYIFITAWTF